VGLLLPSLAAAAVTVAQDTDGVVSVGDDPSAVVDTADDAFDGRSTRDTVRFVVGALVAIAGVTAVALLVFVWHTSPSRRQRVADRRADRGRAESPEGEADELSDAGEPRG
jgi:hypothetical protein